MVKSSVNSSSFGRLFGLHEAAAYLALSHWTVRGMIHRGEMSFVRAGRRILIDRADLDAWIERNKYKEKAF